MEPQVRTDGATGIDPATVRKIKLALLAIGVLGLAVLVYFIVREVKQAEIGKRWDEFAQIQAEYDLGDMAQDPLFEGGPDTSYFQRRANYIAALEAFLPTAESGDDALGPQVHWLIAKLAADQVISRKDDIDVERRAALWNTAHAHMKILNERYPEFQTNWTMFAPTGHISLTRAFLATIEANLKWEKDNLPKARAPDSDPVVVIRTERGDLRVGLYREQAKAITDLFLEHAVRGDYDGTAFYAKADRDRGETPLEHTLRAGSPATRDAKPFDRAAAAAFAEPEYGDLMPADSRTLIPADRGVVLAWHDPASLYDGPQTFVVAEDRSPLLDYDYSPMGKVLDEASLATLDRLYEGETWRDDVLAATPPEEEASVQDFLQAPVKIVKVLVYEGGTLVEPETPSPTKAETQPDEATLAGLKPDAYQTEPPERPAPPAPPEPPEDPDQGPGGSPDETPPDEG